MMAPGLGGPHTLAPIRDTARGVGPSVALLYCTREHSALCVCMHAIFGSRPCRSVSAGEWLTLVTRFSVDGVTMQFQLERDPPK